ncbi:Spermidine-binding periplasmic protein SpuE [Streptomyces sp. MBT84]|nr:Spermidine-binding periplasmic protein SpuE [Streptomyces sp. MBT84]
MLARMHRTPKKPTPPRRQLLRTLGGGALLGALAGCGVPGAYVAPGDRSGAEQPGRDLIVLGDWMCARFVRLGWVQEMDRARQPHIARNLDPLLRAPAFDPGRRFTVPWQSGITGIAYNRRKLGREIRQVPELWASDLEGRVTLLSGLDEAFALLVQGNGVDVARWTADDFHRVCDQVERHVRSGRIRRFTGNDYTKDLVSGDVLACQAYSGDVIQLQADNPDIRFVVPEEGAELWADSLMIPDLARHKANAERLVGHYYEPAVAATLAAWRSHGTSRPRSGWSSPSGGTRSWGCRASHPSGVRRAAPPTRGWSGPRTAAPDAVGSRRRPSARPRPCRRGVRRVGAGRRGRGGRWAGRAPAGWVRCS